MRLKQDYRERLVIAFPHSLPMPDFQMYTKVKSPKDYSPIVCVNNDSQDLKIFNDYDDLLGFRGKHIILKLL